MRNSASAELQLRMHQERCWFMSADRLSRCVSYLMLPAITASMLECNTWDTSLGASDDAEYDDI